MQYNILLLYILIVIALVS